MERKERIDSLRKVLAKEDISAIIIPSNDPHFGEYIPDYYKIIPWLTGFTGEAATLVISQTKAAIWVDSRFFIQAPKQTEGTGVEIMKLKMEGTPSIPQWLKSHLQEDDIVAMDQELFSYADFSEMVDALAPLTPTLIDDPFDQIWKDRPALVFNSINYVDESLSGESVTSKHRRLVEKLKGDCPFAYIVTSLDETCWLCNLRGTDVEYNSLALSYSVVTEENITVFLRQEMLTEEAYSRLNAQQVVIRDYEEIESYLKNLPSEYIRIFSSGRVNAKNYLAAFDKVNSSMPVTPMMPDPTVGGTLAVMKSIKNEVELAGFDRAYREDTKALQKLFRWVEENKTKNITEYDVVKKLIEFRSECPDYLGESFQPIVAFGPNSALPHYAPTEDNCAVIKPESYLLIDTGGQYTYGTTDTTRTLPLGELTQEQKDDYTAVLKGMIDLSMAKFYKGMRGSLLDILARGPVMQRGKIYLHGTGHGIGHNLCVHEGPLSIRMEENPVALMDGMVISNEPAVYIEGQYGIRHENTIIVRPWKKNEFGEFYQFETATYIPIDTTPVNYDMLDESEKAWLEEFNRKISLVG